MLAQGQLNYDRLVDAFADSFGAGQDPASLGATQETDTGGGGRSTMWDGKNVEASVSMLPESRLVRGVIRGKEIIARKKADEDAAHRSEAKEGGKGQ